MRFYANVMLTIIAACVFVQTILVVRVTQVGKGYVTVSEKYYEGCGDPCEVTGSVSVDGGSVTVDGEVEITNLR